MANGYWVARVDVEDMETYKKYVAGVAAVMAKFGGAFLVRAGQFEAVEGQSRARNIIATFESYDKALECWNSDEYQELKKIRTSASTGEIIIIEGI